MSFLFSFSKYIGVPILSEWLLLWDIVNLTLAVEKQVDETILTIWLIDYADSFSKKLFSADKTFRFSSKLVVWCLKYGLDWNVSMYSLSNVVNLLNVDSVRRLQLHSVSPETDYNTLLAFLNGLEEIKILDNSIDSYITNINGQNLRTCTLSYNVVEYQIRDLCRNCPGLTSLTIARCDCISQGALQSMVIYSRKLQHLNFQTVQNIINHHILILHCKMPLLTLKWSYYTPLRGYELFYLGESLETLHYFGVDESVPLCQLCPNLTNLEIYWYALNKLQLKLDGFSKLKHFNVDFSDEGGNEVIQNLAPNWKHMTELTPSGLGRISNKTVQSIAIHLTGLTYLELSGCCLSDNCLILIAQGCRLLSSLIITNSAYVTDTSMVLVAQYCRKLKKLNVSNTNIGDNTLFSLSKYCKWLWYLAIGSCLNITDQGVTHVMKWLPLCHLSYSGLRGRVSDETIAAIESLNRMYGFVDSRVRVELING